MRYEEFVCATKEKVESLVGKDMRLEFHTTLKNNGKEKIGLAIKQNDINIAPAIYLEEYFKMYESGETILDIAQAIINLYNKARCYRSWDVDNYLVYEKVKDALACKLINYEANIKLLKEVPHVRYLDFAIVFYHLVHGSINGTTTMLFKNEHIKPWGIGVETLYNDAIANAVNMLPAKLESMNSVIGEVFDNTGKDIMENPSLRMYVLSNDIRNFGAACILYPEELQRIGRSIGENYYILPSSIHEVIIMPESIAPTKEELKEMIQCVNKEAVEDEEVLSDHSYYYDCEKKTLLY